MMSSASNGGFASIEAADEAWARTATLDPGRAELYLKIVHRLRAELAYIERSRPRGNATLKLCHPEGVMRKAFLNDREV